MLLLAPLDRGIRGIARNYLRSVAKNPINLFKRLHLQSITIIQPADFLFHGAVSMCDGCPDITVWNDQLVWSCRLEEQMKFGCFVRAVPKEGVRNQPHELISNRVPVSHDENVTVNKAVRLVSLAGQARTYLRSAFVSRDGVRVAGFLLRELAVQPGVEAELLGNVIFNNGNYLPLVTRKQ